VFKGGTSLSKGYDIIRRFSEDIDLTFDVRQLIPDLAVGDPPIPATNSEQPSRQVDKDGTGKAPNMGAERGVAGSKETRRSERSGC
jgi:hypothetical protein